MSRQVRSAGHRHWPPWQILFSPQSVPVAFGTHCPLWHSSQTPPHVVPLTLSKHAPPWQFLHGPQSPQVPVPQLSGPHTRPTQSAWQPVGGGGTRGGGTRFFFFRRFFASVVTSPVSSPRALPMRPASAPRRDADDDSERTMASKCSASKARL